MAEIDHKAKMYYILGMENPIKLYKKAEGGRDMPNIDFNKLADEVENKINEKKGIHTSIFEAVAENLTGKKVSILARRQINEKINEIMKIRKPDLFPAPNLKKKAAPVNPPKIDWKKMSGARRNEYLNTVIEDKNREED